MKLLVLAFVSWAAVTAHAQETCRAEHPRVVGLLTSGAAYLHDPSAGVVYRYVPGGSVTEIARDPVFLHALVVASEDGTKLFAATHDAHEPRDVADVPLSLWDVATRANVSLGTVHTLMVTSASVAPSNRRAVIGTWNNRALGRAFEVQAIDLESHAILRSERGFQAWFVGDERVLVSIDDQFGGRGPRYRVVDFLTGRVRSRISIDATLHPRNANQPEQVPMSATASDAGIQLYERYGGSPYRHWLATARREPRRWRTERREIQVGPAPQGARVVETTSDGTRGVVQRFAPYDTRVVDLATGDVLRELCPTTCHASLARTGSYAIVTDESGQATAIDIATGTRTVILPRPR